MASLAIRRLVLHSGKVVSRVHLSRHCPVSLVHRGVHLSARTLADKYYTEKHEWILVDGKTGTVGISKYAQDKLGEVIYVQLPEVGQELEMDGESGCLESVKAASEVYSPVTGTVTEINPLLSDTPKLINDSPYQKGWLYKMTVPKEEELKQLMSEADYTKFTEGLE